MCPEILKWVIVMVNVVTVAEVPVVGDYVIMWLLSQTDTRGINPYRPLTQHHKFSTFFPKLSFRAVPGEPTKKSFLRTRTLSFRSDGVGRAQEVCVFP